MTSIFYISKRKNRRTFDEFFRPHILEAFSRKNSEKKQLHKSENLLFILTLYDKNVIIRVHDCGIVNNYLLFGKVSKMENIKEIIAKNLVELRKSRGMTQSTLAEMLNYSDKAISRWEHAETLPDIETLCRVCDIYGVSFEYLLQKEPREIVPASEKRSTKGRQVVICLIAMMTVWLTATVLFTSFNMLRGNYIWQLFVWAIPLSCLVAAICNAVWWHSKVWSILTASFTTWTLILALYFQFLKHNLWMLFLVGIPIQAIIILSVTIHKKK